MTKYLSSAPFSTFAPPGDSYADNWETTFGKKKNDWCEACGVAIQKGYVVCNLCNSEACTPVRPDEAAVPPQMVVFKEALKRAEGVFYPRSLQDKVREFHNAYDVPIGKSPGIPSNERARLRLELIAEEFFELLSACGCAEPVFEGFGVYDDIRKEIQDVRAKHIDLEAVADALADIAYVVEGTNIEFGLDSEAILKEVHRSNMSKLGADGKPIYRADGKVLKGPNYSPPNLRGLV